MANFKGVITAITQKQSGTSKAGKAWERIEVVLVYDNSNPQYPKSVVFSVMNARIAEFNLQVGKEYEVELDFDTREWNGRYFLSASCWKATAMAAPAPAPTAEAAPQQGWENLYPQQPAAAPAKPAVSDAEPLPF